MHYPIVVLLHTFLTLQANGDFILNYNFFIKRQLIFQVLIVEIY